MGTLCSKHEFQRRMKEENSQKFPGFSSNFFANSNEFEYLSQASINQFYTFEKYLGAGGFGQVRLARSKIDKQFYAVKTILKERVQGKEYLILRELGILKTLDHPNIIKFHEIYQDNLCFHIVTEYCSGGELLSRLLSLSRSKSIQQYQQMLHIQEVMRQLLSAINYLHSKNICHRDLKPQNILFSTSNNESLDLKVIDFGLSTFFEKNDTVQSYFKSKVGTLMYVAPEVLEGKYTQQCDIWSLGIICFIILTGDIPYMYAAKGELYNKVKKGKINFSGNIWGKIDLDAKKFLGLMLKKKPNQRATASQLLQHEWLKDDNKKVSPLFHDRKVFSNIYKNFVVKQKLKREVLMILVNKLDEDEIKELRSVFEKLDKNQSGILSYEELSRGLKEVGFEASEQEILKILKSIHQNVEDLDPKKQQIKYTEFLSYAIDAKKMITYANLQNIFTEFDTDHKQYFTKQDLKQFLARKGRKLKSAVVEQMIAEVDLDQDGKVDFQEFVRIMKEEDNQNVQKQEDVFVDRLTVKRQTNLKKKTVTKILAFDKKLQEDDIEEDVIIQQIS